MKAKNTKSVNKHVFSKMYFDPFHIVKAAEIITNKFADLELSILGKTSMLHSAQNMDQINPEVVIKDYTNTSTKVTMQCDYFYNPEIGYIFVTGPLTSIFLNNLEGKLLGAISSGPYGILRGLGISNKEATAHLKGLKKGGYLMIVRGHTADLELLKSDLSTSAFQNHAFNSQLIN